MSGFKSYDAARAVVIEQLEKLRPQIGQHQVELLDLAIADLVTAAYNQGVVDAE